MSESSDPSGPFRRAFVLGMLIASVLAFVVMIRAFVVALVFAVVFAGLLAPVYDWIRGRLGGRARLAALATIAASLLVIGLPLAGLLAVFVTEAMQVAERVGPFVQDWLAGDASLAAHLPAWVPRLEVLEPYRAELIRNLAQAMQAAGSWVVSSASSLTQGTLGVLLAFFVLLYALFFFLVEGPALIAALGRYVPLTAEDRALLFDRSLAVTKASLKGLIVVGSLQGLLLGAAFAACGLPGPTFWGSIAFVLSAVPGLGSALVWIPAAAYLGLTGSIGWAIALALWGAIVVGSVDNLLRPLVVGREARLPDLVVLVSVLGGIAAFGAIGLVLGPILAALVDTQLEIYRRAFAERLPPSTLPARGSTGPAARAADEGAKVGR